MQSPYLVRTAAVVTIAAAAFTAGWMGMPTHSDGVPIEPQIVLVDEPSGYFPAAYELKPNPAEREVFDYD